MTAPERSLAQRMTALERANVVRVEKAKIKRALEAGQRSIHTLLLDPPAVLENAKVFEILLAVPKYGRVKVNKALTQCRISPSKTLGGLSQRQRDELVSLLRRPVITSGTPEYQALRRMSNATAIHMADLGDALCRQRAAAHFTPDPSEVTCLVCASILRKDVRQRLRDEAAAYSPSS